MYLEFRKTLALDQVSDYVDGCAYALRRAFGLDFFDESTTISTVLNICIGFIGNVLKKSRKKFAYLYRLIF